MNAAQSWGLIVALCLIGYGWYRSGRERLAAAEEWIEDRLADLGGDDDDPPDPAWVARLRDDVVAACREGGYVRGRDMSRSVILRATDEAIDRELSGIAAVSGMTRRPR